MRKSLAPILVGVVVAATRLRALPRTCWQGEEVGFTRALLTFDPAQHQPEAPAYPLTVGLGKLVNAFVHEPFAALVALSVIASIAGAFMLALAFTRILGDEWSGAAASAIVYLSPAMLVFTPLPNADGVSMALVAATLLTFARGDTALFGICAGAAVAARPQLVLAALVLVLFARRGRVAFVATLLITFAPLLQSLPHVGNYARSNWEATRIASAASGVAGRELAMRFIAHPWGPKLLSLPLLAIAAAGAVMLARKRDARAFGVALFAATHLAFCVVAADRSDGVQPLLPALVAVALFAAAPLRRFAIALAFAYGIAAMIYVEPIVRLRGTDAPAAAATAYAARSKAVVIYDPSMEPFARNGGFAAAPLAALDRFATQPNVPLVLLAEGAGAKTFAWPDSDAYGKVTTEHYRVVSVSPIPPASRYIAGEGVYQLERTVDGREWRWLAPRASIRIPAHTHARIVLGLPANAAEDNRVTLNDATAVVVRRGETVEVDVDATTITFRAERSFTPPGEHRTLAVQLLRVTVK